jgi:periplasmic protein TonB
MLKTLIESRPPSTGSTNARWGAASVMTHAVLIVGAVAATAAHPPALGANERPHEITYVTVDERASHPTAPTNTRPDLPVIHAPGTIARPTIVFHPEFNCDPGAPISLDSLLNSMSTDTIGEQPLQPGTTSEGVYEAAAVDRAVSPFSSNPQPLYPAQLRAAGIEGSVVARFVVDTLGRVEPGSIAFTSAAQSAFSDAVRYALVRSRFVPAQFGRTNVRQLVEQRFSFTLR